ADEAERAFWRRVIEKGDQREGDLEQALRLMARHRAMEATRDDALGWAERAKQALVALPAHDLRDLLADLADYVVARVNRGSGKNGRRAHPPAGPAAGNGSRGRHRGAPRCEQAEAGRPRAGQAPAERGGCR